MCKPYRLCSNRAATRVNLLKRRNASTQKYHYLQVFCNLLTPPATYRAAYTRQGSLVRTQHRPLRKERLFAGKCEDKRRLKICVRSSVQQRGSDQCLTEPRHKLLPMSFWEASSRYGDLFTQPLRRNVIGSTAVRRIGARLSLQRVGNGSSNIIACPSSHAAFHAASSSRERAAARYGSRNTRSAGACW